MKLRILAPIALLLTALATLACVTINVYFPEAAVKDLSDRIEEAVIREAAETEGEGDAEEEGEAPSGESSSNVWNTFERGLGAVLHALPASEALAQDVAAPEITNPAIRQIVESRGKRVKAINAHKSTGVLGENQKALLEIRDLASLGLRDRATVQKLVKEENADRERMFKEIAAATGTDLSQLPQIQATYAETLRSKARTGDWIQEPDGTWTQK